MMEIEMRTLDEMERQLRDKRRQSGWYGMRGDWATERQLTNECYDLFVEIEYLKRTRAIEGC
jgi:hypothetical protein